MNIQSSLLLLALGSVASCPAFCSQRKPTKIQLLAAEFEVSPTVIKELEKMREDAEKIRSQFNAQLHFQIPCTDNPFSPYFIKPKKPATNEDYVAASKKIRDAQASNSSNSNHVLPALAQSYEGLDDLVKQTGKEGRVNSTRKRYTCSPVNNDYTTNIDRRLKRHAPLSVDDMSAVTAAASAAFHQTEPDDQLPAPVVVQENPEEKRITTIDNLLSQQQKPLFTKKAMKHLGCKKIIL